MTNIYDLHTKAFSHVSAYVILKDGERVATIALKYPKDGAGRLYAYVHYIGLEMVRDYAGGYGYDKRSAAITSATAKIKPYMPSGLDGEPLAPWQVEHKKEIDAALTVFQNALSDIGGKDWSDALRDAGFTVLQAV